MSVLFVASTIAILVGDSRAIALEHNQKTNERLLTTEEKSQVTSDLKLWEGAPSPQVSAILVLLVSSYTLLTTWAMKPGIRRYYKNIKRGAQEVNDEDSKRVSGVEAIGNQPS